MSEPQFEEAVFPNLPEAMVEEVLKKSNGVASDFLAPLEGLNASRKKYREGLKSEGMLKDLSSELGKDGRHTTCASDGTYVIENLMASDLTVAAAVCVEGLVPPADQGHWPGPRHEVHLDVEFHHEKTKSILRAIMVGEELRLLAAAPHDLAMFDGNLLLPLISFNLAMSAAHEIDGSLKCGKKFQENCLGYLQAYLAILRSADRVYVGMPKYSVNREIGKNMGWPESIDDRALLSILLEEGEMTRPVKMNPARDSLNIGSLPEKIIKKAGALEKGIQEGLNNVRLFYFKPRKDLPALRVEISGKDTGGEKEKISVHGLNMQMQAPAMLEPYPLYLADRYAKDLAKSMPAVRQVITHAMSRDYAGNIRDVLFATNPYRSEDRR